MTGTLKLTAVEARLLIRDMITLPVAVAIPLAILVVFGVLPGSDEPSPELGGHSAIDSVLPSMSVAIGMAVLALNILPTYLATYRERGILRRLSTTPASPAGVLVAQLVVNLSIALLTLGLVVGVGMLFLGMHAPANVVGFAASFVFGTAALFGVGLLIAAIASSAKASTGWGMLLFFPSLFFAGIYLQREQMPAILVRIGDFTPLGAFRQTVRDSWVGETPDWRLLVFMAVLAVLCGWGATRRFRWE